MHEKNNQDVKVIIFISRDEAYIIFAEKRKYKIFIKYQVKTLRRLCVGATLTTELLKIEEITIYNVLVDGLYNDLGFRVGDRQIILVEAQSTWSVNIIGYKN